MENVLILRWNGFLLIVIKNCYKESGQSSQKVSYIVSKNHKLYLNSFSSLKEVNLDFFVVLSSTLENYRKFEKKQ